MIGLLYFAGSIKKMNFKKKKSFSNANRRISSKAFFVPKSRLNARLHLKALKHSKALLCPQKCFR